MPSSVILPPSVSPFLLRGLLRTICQQHIYAEKLPTLQNRAVYTLHVSEYENCAKLMPESMAIVLVIWCFFNCLCACCILEAVQTNQVCKWDCSQEDLGFSSVTLYFNFFMTLSCLVLFIMPCGRSYLWLIILKQFLYFISVEFPLEDATKEVNHANKAYHSRGSQKKAADYVIAHLQQRQIHLGCCNTCPSLFSTFFFPRMGGNDSQSLIATFPVMYDERISEQTWSRKLKHRFTHFFPQNPFQNLLNCPAGWQCRSWGITPQNCQLIK